MDLEDSGKVIKEFDDFAGVESGWSGVVDIGFKGFETGGKGLGLLGYWEEGRSGYGHRAARRWNLRYPRYRRPFQ